MFFNINKLNESKTINKKLIRITESDLHRIVKESVDRVLNEVRLTPEDDDNYTYTGTIGGEDADWYSDGEDLKQAWMIFWRELKASRGSMDGAINWGLYQKYKNDPVKIADWFEKYGIEYRDLLDDAGKSLEYRYWPNRTPKA